MTGATITRRVFVAAALGAAVAGLGGCAGPSGVSGGEEATAGGNAGTEGSGASWSASDLDLVEAGTLSVAARADNLPYFQDANNARSGFVYELMEAAAARLGVSCTWSKVASRDSLLSRAQESGETVRGKQVRVDVAACTFDCSTGATSEVEGDFARLDYLTVTQCLVAKKSSSISGADDLPGAKIGVLEGSVGSSWAAGVSDASVVEYATLTELFSGLQARNVDAAVADLQAANHYLRVAYGDEQIVCDVDAGEVSYSLIMPASHQELLSALQSVLQALRDDGTYQQLCEHWFSAADNSRGKTDARTPEQGAPGHDKGGGV